MEASGLGPQPRVAVTTEDPAVSHRISDSLLLFVSNGAQAQLNNNLRVLLIHRSTVPADVMYVGGLVVTRIFTERVLFHPRRRQLRLVVLFVVRDGVIPLATRATRDRLHPSLLWFLHLVLPLFLLALSQTSSGARPGAPGLREQLHAPRTIKGVLCFYGNADRPECFG